MIPRHSMLVFAIFVIISQKSSEISYCIPPRQSGLVGFALDQNALSCVKSVVGPLFGNKNGAASFTRSCDNPAVNTSKFTVAFYYFLGSRDPTATGIIMRFEGQNGGNFSIEYELEKRTLLLAYNYQNTTKNSTTTVSFHDILKKGAWNFLVVMFDFSTLQLKVAYENQNELKEINTVISRRPGFNNNKQNYHLILGRGRYLSAEKDAISCLALYNETLTLFEIRQIQRVCRYRQTKLCSQPKTPASLLEKRTVEGLFSRNRRSVFTKQYFTSAKVLTLKDAESFCKLEGGQLAMIKSAAENTQAIALMKPNNYYWIGLKRSGAGEPWRWIDGSEPSYTNWNENEPNNKGGEELCVEGYSHNGKWNDVGCTAGPLKIVLCEKVDPRSSKIPMHCQPPKGDESLLGFWLADFQSYRVRQPGPICADLDPTVEGPFGRNNTAFVQTCQNGTFFPSLNIWTAPKVPITSFTISFFYRYIDQMPGNYGLMSFQDDSPKANFAIDYQLGKSNGTGNLIISFGPGPVTNQVSFENVMKPNIWNFLSVMFESSTMQLTVFHHNGENKLQATVATALLLASRGSLILGHGTYAMPVRSGAISCLLLHRQTLSPLEVEQVQQACRFRQTGQCEKVVSENRTDVTVVDRRKPLPPKITSLLGIWLLDDLLGLENMIPSTTQQQESELCAKLDEEMPGPFGRRKTSFARQCKGRELAQFQWLFPSSETERWLDSYTVSFYFFAQTKANFERSSNEEERGLLHMHPYLIITYNETAGVVEVKNDYKDNKLTIITAALTADEWNFIAVTFNSSNNVMNLYQSSPSENVTLSAMSIPPSREEEQFTFLFGGDGRTLADFGDRFSCLLLHGASLTPREIEQVQAYCKGRLSAEDKKAGTVRKAGRKWQTLIPVRETVLPTSTMRSKLSTAMPTSTTTSTVEDKANMSNLLQSTTGQSVMKKHFFTIHFRTYKDAEQSCVSAGGRLAMIKSAEENAQAAAIMQSDYRYWIGLKRNSASEPWYWLDGTQLNFTKWNIGEPNNAHGDEYCAEYAPNGRWNDVQCTGNMRIGVLCEEQIKIPVHKMATIPESMQMTSDSDDFGHEYFAVEANLTWFDARDKCEEEGGHLAMIKSSEENARAYDVMTASDRSRTFWIGLRRENSESPWRWIDGTELNYSNWNYGEPNNNHGNEWCTSSRPGQRRRWNDLRCDYNQFHAIQLNWDDTPYALCERRHKNEAGAPQEPVRSRKKYFAIYGSYRADRASSLCQELGGRPAMIKSAAENEQANIIMDPREHYWISLTRGLSTHESWTWPDGTDLEFSNWDLASGQPDSRGGNEWCVEYRSSQWNDLACEATANILCEKIYHYYSSSSNETNRTSAANPFPEQEKKYFVVFEPHFSWQDAQAKCQRNGGRLATIKSPEENSRAIITMMKSAVVPPGIYWIGLSRENDTSPWRWVDGTELSYSNWDDLEGEPNNKGGDELCAEARIHEDHPRMSFGWNDLACDTTKRYKMALCEKFVNPFKTSSPRLSSVTLTTGNTTTMIADSIRLPGSQAYLIGVLLAAALTSAAILTGAGLLIYYLCFARRRKRCRRSFSNVDDDTKLAGTNLLYKMTNIQNNKKDGYEVTWDQVVKSPNVLGEGDFGKVIRGKLRMSSKGGGGGEDDDGEPPQEIEVDVAIRTLQDNATEEERIRLLKEIKLMKHLSQVCGRHPNLVALLACITSTEGDETNSGQMALIMEYCPLGPLRMFLRNLRGKGPQEISQLHQGLATSCSESNLSRHVTINLHDSNHGSEETIGKESQNRPLLRLLLSYAEQICSGMEHLAKNLFIHRNLAGRNVLVFTHDMIKISDFHMVRDIYEDTKCVKVISDRVHVKWTAPEAIEDGVYTSASDVWSFGICLWEITTLGAMPYSLVLNQEMASVLKKGHRLERPPRNCPEGLYEIMLSCWALKPDDRPNFTTLRQRIQNLQQKVSEQ